jgi:hypothetical protein
MKGKCFAAVKTPGTDAANTSRSWLTKNNCLPDRVSKIREDVLCLCRWVHRMDHGLVNSGAGKAAGNGNGPCDREIVIVRRDSFLIDATSNVEAEKTFTVITKYNTPCCQSPFQERN